jgi:hypothetical protein
METSTLLVSGLKSKNISYNTVIGIYNPDEMIGLFR